MAHGGAGARLAVHAIGWLVPGLIYPEAERSASDSCLMAGGIDLGAACARVLQAIARSDAPVGETYAGLRAMALARAHSLRPPERSRRLGTEAIRSPPGSAETLP